MFTAASEHCDPVRYELCSHDHCSPQVPFTTSTVNQDHALQTCASHGDPAAIGGSAPDNGAFSISILGYARGSAARKTRDRRDRGQRRHVTTAARGVVSTRRVPGEGLGWAKGGGASRGSAWSFPGR